MDKENKDSISLGGFNDLIKMRDGWMVYNKNDKFIGKSIKHYGEWSQGELDLCKQFLTPNDVVIEVGSNIGSHTLALSKIVNEGIVFAFEPQKIVFQNLCANLSINSVTNCHCFLSALSDEKDKKLYNINYDFNEENNFGGMSLLKTKKTDFTYEANVQTLDIQFSNLNRLKLLKMDTEGMELNVLKGGIDLINRTKPVLYVENDIGYQEKSKELIELIWSLGYKIFWHTVPLFNVNNFFNNKENLFVNIFSCNMLCIRKEQEIQTNLIPVKDFLYHPQARV